MKSHKKFAIIMSAILATVILTGTSLAWRDINQHKTNIFTVESSKYNVVLVESFEPIENWKMGETVSKKVSVRNGQDSDNTNIIFNDAYIRIQFKEFMAIGELEYVYSKEPLVVDPKGTIYSFITEDLAKQFMDTYVVPKDTRIISLKPYNESSPLFYLTSEYPNDKGLYGKYLVTDIKSNTPIPLIKDQSDHSEAATTQHNEASNDEDLYITHTWSKNGPGYAAQNQYSDYVRWELNENILLIEDWDGKPANKWIIDTQSQEGWVYWGEPLEHGYSLEQTPNSITPDLLEGVTLVKQPTGGIEYTIHVNMETSSLNDMYLWTDAPIQILEAFKAPKNPIENQKMILEKLMEEAKSLNPIDYEESSFVLLTDLLPTIESSLDNNELTLNQLESLTQDLLDTMNALITI